MPGMPAEEPATPSPLQLRLLGVPHWQHAGAGGPLAPRDAALLALLAVDGHVARDRVAAWLWPEAGSQARANLSLRQRLFRLRRDCGHPLVEAALTLSLADGVVVDLHAQPLPTEGLLLAGTDYGAFEAFEQWLTAAREAIGQRQADTLAGRAARLEEAGALAEAIACTEGIVARWPATEHAWRRLMRLHWQRADRAAAIAAFERFEQQVCREWGLRPSHETLALLATIEQAEAGLGTSPWPGAAAGLPPALLHPPTLVGRDATLQALARAWDEGRAALLLAPGGMGKSRLLDSFLAGRAGVLRLRGRPGDAARPYATLAQALDDALTRFAPVLPAATRDELARLVARLGPAPGGPAQPSRLFAAVAQAWQACAAAGLQALASGTTCTGPTPPRWNCCTRCWPSRRWRRCARCSRRARPKARRPMPPCPPGWATRCVCSRCGWRPGRPPTCGPRCATSRPCPSGCCARPAASPSSCSRR